jgi:hypothetical protein
MDFNRRQQNISSISYTIHILLSSSWIFLQNRSYFRTQGKFNKYKKTEITLYILSDYKGIKLKINNKRNCRKYSNTWRLNKPVLKYQWFIKEIRGEVKM